MGDIITLDEVFDNFMNNDSIFYEREILRHEYLPDSLPHREEQIRCLGQIMAPVLVGSRSSNVFVYGKTGTGKTAVTRRVVNYLQSKAESASVRLKVCYINCRLAATEYRIFAALCRTLGVTVPFTGLSAAEVFDRFLGALESSALLLIVVLDEIDAVVGSSGDAFLYELTRINSLLSGSKVTLVAISNDLTLKDLLEPRVLSSLSEEEVVFTPYNASELKVILAERARLAFKKEALCESALSVCAALAAVEHGDARRALDLLRVAGELAERGGQGTVTEEHVREAEKRIEQNRLVEALESATLHSKIVVLGVFHLHRANIQTAITGEIYGAYVELCQVLGVSPLTQRRVTTILDELDMIGILNARIVSRGRYGRSKKVRLGVSRSLVGDVLGRSSRFKDLVDYESRSLLAKLRYAS